MNSSSVNSYYFSLQPHNSELMIQPYVLLKAPLSKCNTKLFTMSM